MPATLKGKSELVRKYGQKVEIVVNYHGRSTYETVALRNGKRLESITERRGIILRRSNA